MFLIIDVLFQPEVAGGDGDGVPEDGAVERARDARKETRVVLPKAGEKNQDKGDTRAEDTGVGDDRKGDDREGLEVCVREALLCDTFD
jgi:hypothetical protein